MICSDLLKNVIKAQEPFGGNEDPLAEVNNTLEGDAAIINQDAENSGWIFKMKVSQPSQYDELMTEDDYKKFLEQ